MTTIHWRVHMGHQNMSWCCYDNSKLHIVFSKLHMQRKYWSMHSVNLYTLRAILRVVWDISKNIFLYKYPKNGLISSNSISCESFFFHLVSGANGTILPNIFNHSSFLSKAIHCPDSTQWKLSHDMLLDDINPFLGYL